MKTFKQFFGEGHISVYKGVKLFGTSHSKQREIERHVPVHALRNLHKKVVDKIHSGEYTPSSGKTFMVFDKEHKQTVLMDYRHDKLNPRDTKKHLFLVSAYNPTDVGKPRHGQDRVVTENEMAQLLKEASTLGYSPDFIQFIRESLNNPEMFIDKSYFIYYNDRFILGEDGEVYIKVNENYEQNDILEV